MSVIVKIEPKLKLICKYVKTPHSLLLTQDYQ